MAEMGNVKAEKDQTCNHKDDVTESCKGDFHPAVYNGLHSLCNMISPSSYTTFCPRRGTHCCSVESCTVIYAAVHDE